MRTRVVIILIAILLFSNMATLNVKADSPVDLVQIWTTNTAVDWTVNHMELAPGVLVLHQYRYSPDYNNDTLYGLDTRNGKLLWNITILDGGDTGLIGLNRELLFAIQFHPSLQSSKLLAIDPHSGKVVWSADRPKYSTGFVAGDTILTSSNTGDLAAYDASTGAFKWFTPEANGLLVYGNAAMFLWTTAGLIALDLASGAQRWVGPAAWFPQCPSVANGMVYGEQTTFGEGNQSIGMSVIALNATDARTRWNKTYPYFNPISGWCPAFEDGRLFFVSFPAYSTNASAQVIALNTSEGSEQWRRTFPCRNYPTNATQTFGCLSDVHLDSAAVGDGLVFVADGSQYSDTEYNATVYALGTGSGNVVWTLTFPKAWYVRMIYANGTLYMNAAGQVAAFSKQGISVAEFPSTLGLVTFAIAVFGVRLMMKRRKAERGGKEGSLMFLERRKLGVNMGKFGLNYE